MFNKTDFFKLINGRFLLFCFVSFTVTDIQCSFASQGGSSVGDSITAVLKKPAGFKGSPLFADDRTVNPNVDRKCSIEPDHSDQNELTYNLKILDFTKCGVLKRNVIFFKSF